MLTLYRLWLTWFTKYMYSYLCLFLVKTLEAANSLKRQRIKAEAINSDLSQRQRENVMAAFRKGFIKVLVVGFIFQPSIACYF